MGEYRPGVLIHNWNEDNFGRDLVSAGKKTFPTPPSITQTAYRNPREVEQDASAATPAEGIKGLEGGICFENLF